MIFMILSLNPYRLTLADILLGGKVMKLWVLLLAFFSVVVYADKDDLNTLQKQQDDWYVVKQDNTRNVITYAKHEDGKRMRSFRVEAIVDASLATLAGIHFDISNIKRWYWETKESKLINKISDTEYLYYMQFNTPLAPDRDAVIHAKIEPYQDITHPYMLLRLEAKPSSLPVPPNIIRVSAFDMDIKFIPLMDGKTKMEVQGYVDPSGDLPAWTVNLFQRQAPYATMLGLYRMTQKTEYAKLKLPLAFTYMR